MQYPLDEHNWCKQNVMAPWELILCESAAKANTQDCSGRQNQVLLFSPHFWPNPGPARRLLDSDRRDAEFAGVFASVAFLRVSFVPNPDFGIRPTKKVKQYVQARPEIETFWKPTSEKMGSFFSLRNSSNRGHIVKAIGSEASTTNTAPSFPEGTRTTRGWLEPEKRTLSRSSNEA